MPQSAAKRKTAGKPPRISVLLTPEEYTNLETLATVTERSMSWLGRYAVRKLLNEYADKQLPLHLDMPKEGS